MSKMAELYYDIELMLEQGDHPTKISKMLEVPIGMVYDVLESFPDPDQESNLTDITLINQ
jgi:hypothetical protein